MKKLSFLFILAGLILISVGGYQYIKAQAAEAESLNEAIKLLEERQPIESSSPSNEKFSPDQGETVGMLEIPSIDAQLPIVEGTDPDELAKGVGHYKGSAFPLDNDQIVLSGHRDTVFRGLGDVEIGDELIIKLPYGEFRYEMVQSEIVDAEDRTVIKSTAPNEELILTTCYPFSYVGNAPDRYIITAKPID